MRDFAELGECIIYVTEAYVLKYEAMLKENGLDETNLSEDSGQSGVGQLLDDGMATGEGNVRVENLSDEAVVASRGKGKKTKYKGPLADRDARFLIWYIITKRCRRIPWDIFFENARKGKIIQP